MPRRTIGVVVGVLAATCLAAPLAQAARPAKVTVRVESLTRTLVSRTVTTTRRAVVKDGRNGCSGTSAAGALELASGGRWTGSWFDGLGYALDSVDGVRPAGFDYWTLWINGRASMTGLCDTELQRGDEVLEFICHDAQPPTYACANRPLALIAPRGRFQAGTPVAIRVVELNDDGSTVPALGATVTGGTRVARANARGRAMVLLPAGQSTLRATRAGDVPSAGLYCVSGEESATCGSTDRVPPLVSVNSIDNGETFMAGAGPRLLRGMAVDPDGASTAIRLVRRLNGRCAAYHENREAFRPCGRRLRPPFVIGDRARWSFLLPSRLGPGSYLLDVWATDGAGNTRKVRVRFTVEG
ncbi:MAG TPA: hypothetical protein VK506_01195 [Conexibacter sp.]|nr:hypothetical protein [Conexibacter sp.]